MSENFWLVVVGCSSGLFAITMLMLTTTGSEHKSTIEIWLEKRAEIKLKELEVKKLQAEHLQKCPRLTDTPRST